MDNLDFNESAYIVRQPEATDDSVFAPATDRPFADSDYAAENGVRPSPVLSDDGKADKTHENGEIRPEPRRKHPHLGNKGDGKDGDRASDGKRTERNDGATERDGRPHGNRSDGRTPNGEHRPVPLPNFPENDGNRNPEMRPAPYKNDGAEQTERTERAELERYTEHTERAGRKDVVSDGAFRPLPQGGLTDKIVPRALTDAENTATAVALNNQSVAGARAIETADGVLVAVLLDPVFLASERRGLKETLRAEIENATGACAVVTYDLGVYRNIRPDMTDEAKAALYAAATARN